MTGSPPRTPFSISAAWMPSSIDSASSLRRRREAERDVLQHLDQHAAEAERDQLAEAAVGDRADDHFLAALAASAAPGRRRSFASALYFFALAMIVS